LPVLVEKYNYITDIFSVSHLKKQAIFCLFPENHVELSAALDANQGLKGFSRNASFVWIKFLIKPMALA
jgi:hypothetical protein